MESYLILFCCMLVNSFNTVLSKRFSRSMNSDMLHFIEYNFLNALIASAFLFAMNGFSMKMNLPTVLYSLAYAAVVILAVSLNVLALKHTTVYLVGLTSLLGSLIVSTLFGIIVLGDPLTPQVVISVILMISAVALPYLQDIKSGECGNILIPVLYFLIGGASNIVTKLFTLDPRVTDSRSFFVMTNIVIVAVSAVVMAVFLSIKPSRRSDALHAFTPREIGNIAARTALSNVSSVLGIIAIAGMTLGAYTVTSSSFAIFSGAILSALVFREKLRIATCLSVVLAAAAVVISAT